MPSIFMRGITILFPEEVKAWWQNHGGNIEDVVVRTDCIELEVSENRLGEVEELLKTEAPIATYNMLFPTIPGVREIPLLFQGPAFVPENTRLSWATGQHTPLSALPRELRRAKPR